MASDILDRVGMVITDTGAGALTAVTANVLIGNRFNTPAEAGAVNGSSYWWMLEEDNDFEIFEGVWTLSTTKVSRSVIWQSKIAGVHGTTKMTLGGNATLRSITPAEALNYVRFDAVQSLTAAQTKVARDNIAAAGKFNYIINGAMMVSQENGSTALTGASGYPVDDLMILNTAALSHSTQQVASVSPAGSPNRVRVTVTASGTPSTGNVFLLRRRIEGFRVADLRLGVASAKQFTHQIGVRAPAGTYGVSFLNATADRVYVGQIVIAAGEANTDVVKTVSITGDTTGTWAKDSGTGLWIDLCLAANASILTAPGSWAAPGGYYTNAQTNLFATNGNVFELFDVGLYEGAVAPAFKVPDYQTVLIECQRYFERVTGGILALGHAISTTSAYVVVNFVKKRATPSFGFSSYALASLYSAAGAGIALGGYSGPFNISTQSALIAPVVGSGLTAGAGTEMYDSSGAYIDLNSRL